MRLEVTRRADLAVRALAALADVQRRLKGAELAELLETTPGFVPQVMTPLVERGWVRSEPGPNGGYALETPITELSVLDVIEAVEGPTDTGRCVLAERECGAAAPCALHNAWATARGRLLDALSETTLDELAVPAASVGRKAAPRAAPARGGRR
jgi:Rrf2 family protein